MPARLLLSTVLAALVGGCAAGPPPRCAFPAVPSEPPFHYQVAAGPGAEELCVAVALPAGIDRLRGEREMMPFVRGVEVRAGDGPWEEAETHAGAFSLPGCGESPCRARYRVLLGEAARGLDDRDKAMEQGPVLLAPAAAWLLRPLHPATGVRYELRVSTPPASRTPTASSRTPAGRPRPASWTTSTARPTPPSARCW